MNLKDIIKVLDVIKIYNEIEIKVDNFSIDTRTINKNDIYVGIHGDNFNGNLFYQDAFDKGASVCILDENNIDISKLNKDQSIIIVKDSIIALGNIAKYKRSKYDIPVIAVTGSAGKTSTKDMIYSVLSKKYNTLKTIGNKNNHIGLPLTILSLKDEEAMVVEMGMNHFGEIDYLTKIAQPNVVVITNIGTAHIGILGSRENILKAKLEILNGLSEKGLVILNNDDDLLNNWMLNNKDKYQITSFGELKGSNIKAEDIKRELNKSLFTCNNQKYLINVGGEHYIYNALAAVSVGDYFKIPKKEMADALANFELSSDRMNIIKTKEDILIIDDCYNANYDAVKYALRDLGNQIGRKIAVLGTMRELGKYSVKLHSKLGIEVVKNQIDLLITVGDYTNKINKKAIKLGFNKDNSFHFKTNEEAIAFINKIKKKNDNILVKASQSCHFKEIVEKIK